MDSTNKQIISALWDQLGANDYVIEMLEKYKDKCLPIDVRTNRYSSLFLDQATARLATTDLVIRALNDPTILGYRLNLTNLNLALSPELDVHSTSILKAMTMGLCQENDSPFCMEAWSGFFDKPTPSDLMSWYSHQDSEPQPPKRCKKQVPWIIEKCGIHARPHLQLRTLGKDRSSFDTLNEIFPPASSGDWAHTRLDLETLLGCLSSLDRTYKTQLLHSINAVFRLIPLGSYNSTITGLILAVCSFRSCCDAITYMLTRGFCCLNSKTQLLKFKQLSDGVRRTHHDYTHKKLSADEIVELSYWHMCSSRQLSASNWKKEKEERQQPNDYKDVAGMRFKTRLWAEIELAITQIMTSRYMPICWDEFVVTRQRFVSAGSTGGVKTTIGGELYTAGKRVFFENVPYSEVLGWLESTPKILANASEKFELGKPRAIYGTQPTDFFIMSYVLSSLESNLESLPGVQHVNTSPTSFVRMFKRLDSISDAYPHALMIDFANFNLQHTLEIQSFVFKCIAKRAALLKWPMSYIKAAKWCAEAMLNSWIKYPDEEEAVRIKQGLFSGLRGTAFLNSLLNYCYFKTADYLYQSLYPSKCPKKISYHQGDDVWINSDSKDYNVLIYHILVAAGFIFEPSKQNICDNNGEFLRVWYSHSGCRGFPARAIASLIISPLQSNRNPDHIEDVRALDSQLRVLQRRGVPVNILSALWRSLIVFGVRKSLPEQVPNHTIENALSVSCIYGGLGCPDPRNAVLRRSRRICSRKPVFMPRLDIPENAQAYMSADLVCNLASVVSNEIDLATLATNLKRCNYSGWEKMILSSPEAQELFEVRTLKWVRQFQKISLDLEAGMDVVFKRERRIRTETIQQLVKREIDNVISTVRMKDDSNRPPRRNTLASLKMAALAKSPYASIAEIKTAASCSTFDAFNILVAACQDENISRNLKSRLHHLFSGEMVTVRPFWLDNLASMPVALTSHWHPDLASVIHGASMDRLMTLCTLFRVHDIAITSAYAFEVETTLLSEATRDTVLNKLSRY